MTRLALSFAGTLLLALSVAACGGDADSDADAAADDATTEETAADVGDAPTDASTEEFCAALTSTQVKNGKDVAKLAGEIEQTGTPEDIPEQERQGFNAYLEALQDIDEDATQKDLQQQADLGLDEQQQADVQAFMTYAQGECAPAQGQGQE